jgi:hypothetical protein
LATPSLSPAPDMSPMMTWGKVEGTPLPIEGNETPVTFSGENAKIACKLILKNVFRFGKIL